MSEDDDLRRLLAEASPAPWKYLPADEGLEDRTNGIVDANENDVVKTDDGCYPPDLVDAQLIVALRNRAPSLLDELSSLKEYLANSIKSRAIDEISLTDQRDAALAEVRRLRAERNEARAWVRRLIADRSTLTCVYCGQSYPPGTPDSGENIEALTAHIKRCEKHPMHAAEAELDLLRRFRDAVLARIDARRRIDGEGRTPYMPEEYEAAVDTLCETETEERSVIAEARAAREKGGDRGK